MMQMSIVIIKLLTALLAIVDNVPKLVKIEPSPSIASIFFFCTNAKPNPIDDANPIVPNI